MRSYPTYSIISSFGESNQYISFAPTVQFAAVDTAHMFDVVTMATAVPLPISGDTPVRGLVEKRKLTEVVSCVTIHSRK